MSITLRQLQDEQKTWVAHNFGARPVLQPFIGMVEELGELAHAILKLWQGIRGSPEELEAEAKDALADLIVFACDYATSRGWDLETLLGDTWAEVKQRDFKKYPRNGRTE